MNRRIAALQALAERPGTEAEGRVAKEKLAAALAREEKRPARGPWVAFQSYLRTKNIEDLEEAVRSAECSICGKFYPRGLACRDAFEHLHDHARLCEQFPRGTRVYYNFWAYPPNCPATVSGYTATIGWIRLKFDHLKTVRTVPIYASGELRLFTAPINEAAAERMSTAGCGI